MTGHEPTTGRGPARHRRHPPDDRRRSDLGWLPLFRGTDLAAVARAIGDCDVIAVPAGTPLLRPGEANDTVYLLLAGRVTAYLGSALDAENAIDIRPGECIGELSAIDGKPVSALVQALQAGMLPLRRPLFPD